MLKIFFNCFIVKNKKKSCSYFFYFKSRVLKDNNKRYRQDKFYRFGSSIILAYPTRHLHASSHPSFLLILLFKYYHTLNVTIGIYKYFHAINIMQTSNLHETDFISFAVAYNSYVLEIGIYKPS